MKIGDIDSNKKKWLMVALVSAIVLIALVVMLKVWLGSGDSYKIKIENWEELSSQVPETSRERVEEVLYNQVNANLVDDVPSSGAEIRIETQRTVEIDGSLVVGNFIVDVPEIEQSYLIQYFYGDGSEELNNKFNNGEEFEISASVAAYCVTNQEDIIYPDFACEDKYGAVDSDRLVNAFYLEFLLPHTIILEDDEKIVIRMSRDGDGMPQLDVTIVSCNGKGMIAEAEAEARTWITDIGFDADAFTYNMSVKYDYCVVGG